MMTITRTILAAALTAALGLAATQTTHAAERSLALPRLNPLLKAWLQKELGPPDAVMEKKEPTRAISAATALSTSKTEVLVYLIGSRTCGTGGCELYILEFDGKTFRKVGDVTAHPPIRVIPAPYGQHPDLTVMVEGGGVREAYATKLRFSAGHYPMDGGVFSGPALKNPRTGDLMIGVDDKARAEPVYGR